MISRIAILVYVILISVSTLLLGKTFNKNLLLLSGLLFICSILVDIWRPRLRFLQIIFLSVFHYFSQINWCYPLYLILAGKESLRIQSLRRSLLYSMLFATAYTLIRANYSPINYYNLLVTANDYLGFLALSIIVYRVKNTERERQDLRQKFDCLSTHDSLTGLLNYQEFHKQLEELLGSGKQLALFIIDCTDLKSMNNQQGFESGDRILRNIADTLQSLFADAYMIARYGGDEFALAIKIQDKQRDIQKLYELLTVDFPNLSGMQVSYGHSVFPDDGEAKDDLILIAERKLFSMKRDIWLKREEHLLRTEKLRVVGELAAGMAHEIRNPLTTVKGFMQIAKESQFNIEPFYHVIMEEITRMSELTGEFLQFSKPHVMNFKVQQLHECIQRVASLMESEAILLGHQLRLEYESSIPVLMDKDKIVQVVVNLVKNAFEAMTESGTVRIRLYKNDTHAFVEVQDTGAGISESDLDKIFHPFYTTKKNGTGLGLAICHKIIQDHEGTIDIESSEKGTKFKISLPVASVKVTT